MRSLYDFDMVKDCTKVYRRLLDCFSYPMETVRLMEGLGGFGSKFEEFLAIGATVLDREVKFFVERDVALENFLKDITLASTGKLKEADFIFAPSEVNYASLERIFELAKKGSLENPHLSATIVIKCWNDNVPRKCLELVRGLNLEYPLGIDLIFVFDDGLVCAVPRLIKEV